MGLVTYRWSGKHHDVVLGINLITTLWTDEDKSILCNFRIYDKPLVDSEPFDGKAKNEQYQDMLTNAKGRSLTPLRLLRQLVHHSREPQARQIVRLVGWQEGNRPVNPDGRKGGSAPPREHRDRRGQEEGTSQGLRVRHGLQVCLKQRGR